MIHKKKIIRKLGLWFGGVKEKMTLVAKEIKSAKKQRGATMVEYAIMVSLIAIVCIAVVKALGTKTSTVFSVANSAMLTTG